MSKNILKLSNISKSFNGNKVLDNLNLEINEGEIFGIIGVSGSGKTTLLNTMIGFLSPDDGEVLFRLFHLLEYKNAEENFRSVIKQSIEAKKTFGYATQKPSFYPNLSVYENLDYFGSLYGMTQDSIKSNIKTLLALMSLSEWKNILAKNLSGGMQRRLDIACALIHDPKILMLDEPTSDLDPHLSKQIWELIREINRKGTTIVLSSHHLSELELYCTRVGILDQGKFLTVGTPFDVKDNFSKNEEIHLMTLSGNYDEIIKRLKDKDVIEMINKGSELVIKTEKPEKVLHRVLHIIEELNENLIDANIRKPTLDDIFEYLAKEKEKKK